jgi:glycosyltransferase involved in cell wall biosynthesis
LKVLHLTSQFLPWVNGGTEIFCLRLCQQLQKLDVKTSVTLHSSGCEPVGNHTYEGVTVQVLPPIPDRRERTALYKRETANAISFRELLENDSPDVVHFHNFTVSQGITHLRLAKQVGCKVVLTYHTPNVSCSQHGLLYRSQTICDGRLSIYRCSECRLVGAGLSPQVAALAAQISFPWVNPNYSSPLIRLLTTRQMTAAFRDSWQEIVEKVDAIHVLAEWVKGIVELNGAPPEKIHLIRTGGPEPVINREKNSHGISMGQPTPPYPLKLAFIGRSTRIKGIHVLVDAVQQLPEDLPLTVTFFRAERTWEETTYGQELQKRMEADNRFEVKYNLPNDQLLQILMGREE